MGLPPVMIQVPRAIFVLLILGCAHSGYAHTPPSVGYAPCSARAPAGAPDDLTRLLDGTHDHSHDDGHDRAEVNVRRLCLTCKSSSHLNHRNWEEDSSTSETVGLADDGDYPAVSEPSSLPDESDSNSPPPRRREWMDAEITGIAPPSCPHGTFS